MSAVFLNDAPSFSYDEISRHTSEEKVTVYGTNIPSKADLDRAQELNLIATAFARAAESHLISVEHASACFKKYLNRSGFNVPKGGKNESKES